MKNWQALLFRSFREGSVQVWRNRFLSGTTILLGALIVFLLNFIFSIEFFADLSLKNLEERADFSVALREDFDSFDFDALKNEVGMYKTDLNLLPAQNFQNFNLPPRLHIKFQSLTEVSEIFDILKKPRYDSVVGTWDGESEREFVIIIDKLLKVRDGVDKASLWLVLLFLAGGVLLILNTFRIVLFSRKDEVFIARFTGADAKFIAGPFLVEGLLLGLASAMLGVIVFILILRQIEVLPGGEIFLHLWNNIFSGEILLAGLVGILGAGIAVRKYLTGKFTD
ncbi:hypothetical protein K9M41_04440 [Candidatus Gracilibacteria bacterium]|nr:hypothetical protein [Candidatus Gracilibacteria bacterium]